MLTSGAVRKPASSSHLHIVPSSAIKPRKALAEIVLRVHADGSFSVMGELPSDPLGADLTAVALIRLARDIAQARQLASEGVIPPGLVNRLLGGN